jgi:hypothetical protein
MAAAPGDRQDQQQVPHPGIVPRNLSSRRPITVANVLRRNHVSCENLMSGIGGPGGIGGPKGPGGPDGPDDVGDVGDVGDVSDVRGADGAAQTSNIDALAADVAAGKITPQQAVDRLVDEIAGTQQLDASERAELKELMTDLIANDPNLAALVGRI